MIEEDAAPKTFLVDFTYITFANIQVEADSKEEAEAWVLENVSSKTLRCNRWNVLIFGGETQIDHTKEIDAYYQ